MTADTMTKDETIRLQAAEIERLRDQLDTAHAETMEWVALYNECEKPDARDAEIERLRGEVTKYKARLQVMRGAWRETDFATWISYDYPEAREWFDADGVPT